MSNNTVESVLITLRKIFRAISLQSKQLSQNYGITTPQLLVIKSIESQRGMTVGALSKEVNLSQATVTAIIDRLEKKEIVSRERSEQDRRKVQLVLTDKGKAMLDSAPSPVQESFVQAFSELKDWEQTLVLSSLQRVAHMMNASDLPAAPLLAEEPDLPKE